MRTFSLIWSGQLLSLTGSGISAFAVGVWVYLRTGSTTLFALTVLMSSLPGILLAPFTGVFIDRLKVRQALILSDAGGAACSLAIALLLMLDSLELWILYPLLAISATFSSLQWPAFAAAIGALVPSRKRGRAAGMNEAAYAVAQLAAPLIAGMIVATLGLLTALVIDMASFCFSMVALWLARSPSDFFRPEPSGTATLRGDALVAYRHVVQRPGLVRLLVAIAAVNFLTAIVQVLFTPLVLSFASPVALGAVQSAAGGGMVLASIVVSARGVPSARLKTILFVTCAQGVLLFVGVTRADLWQLTVCAFLFFLLLPVASATSHVIWLEQTPAPLQGRVFSLRRAVATSTLPLGYMIAGPLSDGMDHLFREDGSFGAYLGPLFSFGEARGTAVLLALLGLAVAGIALKLLRHPSLAALEKDRSPTP